MARSMVTFFISPRSWFHGRMKCTLLIHTSSIYQPPRKHSTVENYEGLDPQRLLNLLNSCTNFEQMKQLHCQMVTSGLSYTIPTSVKLIEISSSSSSKMDYASLVFREVENPDTHLCNSMIRANAHLNLHEEAIFAYIKMHKQSILPDHYTFPILLKSCSHLSLLDLGMSTHGAILKLGLDCNVFTDTALVYMYCSCKCLDSARQVFDQMPERNSVSWNAMITGYTHNRRFMEALDLFSRMCARKIGVSEVTVVSALSACAHLGALNQGKWVHSFIKQNEIKLNVFVGTALIDMYAKCGSITESEKVFQTMKRKNTFTWNAMISGLAMNGHGEAAVELFSRMLEENVKPDGVTFLAILCACCHQGLVDEGKEFMIRMEKEFALRPNIEHYGCMVDLLGRAGSLNEAMKLINSMPIKPDAAIWRALLAACRVHGNMELSELAIGNLLELEPNKGENYILLANLLVRSQKWDKVAEVRKTMAERRIKKVPGCSSIEVDDVIYEFTVGDEFDGVEWDKIYSMLGEMNRELRLAGHVAGTEMVSYDIEEEEKESSLIYHSEKVAIAFGLLRTLPGTVIRIVKNLRVWKALTPNEFAS
ncbi:Pentatricopeptide repeat-containing protein [Nymphaea thermarum]|nr:Pentatricopeptide repeat-containing protein [Nymphaea thermarum]